MFRRLLLTFCTLMVLAPQITEARLVFNNEYIFEYDGIAFVIDLNNDVETDQIILQFGSTLSKTLT